MSSRLVPSGGIWLAPRVEILVSSIEFDNTPGTMTRLFGSPPVLFNVPLISLVPEAGVVPSRGV